MRSENLIKNLHHVLSGMPADPQELFFSHFCPYIFLKFPVDVTWSHKVHLGVPASVSVVIYQGRTGRLPEDNIVPVDLLLDIPVPTTYSSISSGSRLLIL